MARQAKMTSEGLRKIEKGLRVPELEALHSILDAAEVPETQRDHYTALRARARANKSGIDMSSFVTDHKIERIAQMSLEWFDRSVLQELDMEFSDEELEKYTPDLMEVIRKGMK